MSEVEVVNVGARYGIGTDAKVPGPVWGQCIQVSGVENKVDRPAKEWYKESFSLAAGVIEAMPDLPSYGYYWETTFETELSYSTRPENRKAETAYIYRGAIASMEVEKVVCIRDIVGSELCISSNNGQKVFGALKSAISQGYKVRLSFENIKSLSASFLDSAIGQLYNGEIKEDIDEKLSYEKISPGRRLVTERAVREAKAYYSDPKGYSAKMEKIFADD